MELRAYILIIFICIQSSHCCPGLYQATCQTYQQFLTQNQEVVQAGTDKILRSLDVKYSRCGHIDIRELTIAQAQQLFLNGSLTSEQLTTCYLNRIRYMNPYLKAIIELNPDALDIARDADLKRSTMRGLSGIHGIPIVIKDNYGTCDKMQTTVGAIALENVFPKEDSDAVKRIREAGGVIIGKTNPSEWTNIRGTGLPGGWSGRGGQTLSPYVLISNPSDSSSGSAVAVAANLAMIALGTEGDHSTIGPASTASLVGVKPTLGLISTKGIIPISQSQNTVGVLARTVGSANAMSAVLVEPPKNYYRPSAQSPYRIGVPRNPFWNQTDVLIGKNWQILESVIANLRNRAEVCVVDPVEGDLSAYAAASGPSELILLRHEFKYYVNEYLSNDVIHKEGKLGRSIRTLADVIEFNIENPSPEGYNQNNLIGSEATDGLENSTYRVTRVQNIVSTRTYLNSLLDGNNLDVIVAPCQSEYALLFNSFGAISGYPYTTVPAGINEDGIPVGICFLGRPNSEHTIAHIAEIIEEDQNGRQRPNFNLNSLSQQGGWVNSWIDSVNSYKPPKPRTKSVKPFSQEGWFKNGNPLPENNGWDTDVSPPAQQGWVGGRPRPGNPPGGWNSRNDDDYSPPWPTESSLW